MLRIALSLSLIFFSIVSWSQQLDSVQVQLNYVSGEPLDATNQIFQVKVWVNDIDFLGEVIVDVLDQSTETPLSRVKKTKDQILSEQLFIDGWIILNIGMLDSQTSYIVKTTARNYQLLDLPQIISIYNGNN